VNFSAVKFAGDDDLLLGETVIALGNPFGLGVSVSRGILSSKARRPPNRDEALDIPDWLQIDASINPGNSGGALVNQRGELVGINVAIATASSSSTSSGQSGSIGVGFAIPSNVAKRIGNELMTTGKASHGLFGALVSDNGSAKSAAVGFSTGALVQKVTKGGAAETAGIQAGDVVTKFDGHLIASSGDLTAAVRFLPAHSKVVVEVNRNGKILTLDVTLGDLATLK
jgi:putative serine protease PepD